MCKFIYKADYSPYKDNLRCSNDNRPSDFHNKDDYPWKNCNQKSK